MQIQTLSITVIDRAGLHTGVWTPPPSQQPAKFATAQRFDRSAIMRAAWVDYRAAARKGWTGKGFDAERWSYCLSFAWSLAKSRLAKADAEAKEAIRLRAIIAAVSLDNAPRKLADPAKQARAEAIRAELQVNHFHRSGLRNRQQFSNPHRRGQDHDQGNFNDTSFCNAGDPGGGRYRTFVPDID